MTNRLPIPDWNPSGHLPPFLGSPTAPEGGSPYRVALTDLVLRFRDTAARRALLGGLLNYRAALHAAGAVAGFQWVDGSFVANVKPNPSDIDVVTFFQLPTDRTQRQWANANSALLNPQTNKNRYGIDGYTIFLDANAAYHPAYWVYLARNMTYWHSLWSHDIQRRWKGYLEIDLASDEDAAAQAILDDDSDTEVSE